METSSDVSRQELDKQLSFALYGATGRMIRLHKPFLEPLGLTFPQYLVMVELLDRSPRSVGELGARVGMDTGTITPLVKRLEQSGLVTRQRDTHDERRVLVNLTPEGAALREGVWAVPKQIITACKITDAQAEELRAILDSMGQSAEV
ncbi:MarR family winged helix-turn-helix transcriptional regulator [Sinorhizobium meliloti]|uniref:MarR family winged helix-turn-helix transcriptional regulator n=2 Tax=Rhizobium meliloti TaxID=382 RepID=UPI000FDBB752|nr:MarR family transcriptional regulator [Sinorhizobium meliloti]RVG72772.1 MarR family transcriptional regulator [Sinorhizobium meliloti]RVH39531.1 MarR family transcriptional regulator [Sinorhizobium meliloti]RVO62013.1 MarR family transcriptional regulator [Sinorhizobium meliloti]